MPSMGAKLPEWAVGLNPEQLKKVRAHVHGLEERLRIAENELVHAMAMLESIHDVLEGREVSDFMESFALVYQVSQLKDLTEARARYIQALEEDQAILGTDPPGIMILPRATLREAKVMLLRYYKEGSPGAFGGILECMRGIIEANLSDEARRQWRQEVNEALKP